MFRAQIHEAQAQGFAAKLRPLAYDAFQQGIIGRPFCGVGLGGLSVVFSLEHQEPLDKRIRLFAEHLSIRRSTPIKDEEVDVMVRAFFGPGVNRYKDLEYLQNGRTWHFGQLLDKDMRPVRGEGGHVDEIAERTEAMGARPGERRIYSPEERGEIPAGDAAAEDEQEEAVGRSSFIDCHGGRAPVVRYLTEAEERRILDFYSDPDAPGHLFPAVFRRWLPLMLLALAVNGYMRDGWIGVALAVALYAGLLGALEAMRRRNLAELVKSLRGATGDGEVRP